MTYSFAFGTGQDMSSALVNLDEVLKKRFGSLQYQIDWRIKSIDTLVAMHQKSPLEQQTLVQIFYVTAHLEITETGRPVKLL